MVFHCSLNDSKYPQVSRTLLSILTVLNNVVVWMVPVVRQLPSLPVPLVILLLLYQKHQSQFGIIITFMFHSFFNSLARSRVLSFFSSITSIKNSSLWNYLSHHYCIVSFIRDQETANTICISLHSLMSFMCLDFFPEVTGQQAESIIQYLL